MKYMCAVLLLVAAAVSASVVKPMIGGGGGGGGDDTAECPKDWYIYNITTCFSLFDQLEPWDEARNQCAFQQAGADLAIVDTEEKKSFIHTMLHADPPFMACGIFGLDEYWIGAHDIKQEDHFEWLDTGVDVSYTNWQSRQPDDQFGEDCVEADYDDAEWNDEDCDSKRCFVCEFRL